MKSRLNNSSGTQAFTLVELLVIVFAGSVFVSCLLSELAQSRAKAKCQEVNCLSNLKQVGLSFRTWALDNSGKYPMQVSVTNGGSMEFVNSGKVFPHYMMMSNELCTPTILVCPEQLGAPSMKATSFGIYPGVPGAVPFTNDNQISYFVGVDASESEPRMLLAGDRNFGIGALPFKRGLREVPTNSPVTWVAPRHGSGGNICLADGSVTRVLTPGLRSLLARSGVSTNRLAMP